MPRRLPFVIAAAALVASCRPVPRGPARAELIAAGDRRLAAGEPAAALADYDAARSEGAEVQARRKDAADALARDAIARAADLAARGESIDAVRAVMAMLRAYERRSLDEPPELARALVRIGEAHFVRAGQAIATSPLAADLHLRIAAALGVDVGPDAVELMKRVTASRGVPIVVKGGGPGCAEVFSPLGDRFRARREQLPELVLTATFEVTCRFEHRSDGVHEMAVTGSLTLELAGSTDRIDVASGGRVHPGASRGYPEKEAAQLAVGQLASGLESSRADAVRNLAAHLRAGTTSADWRERDTAAAALWVLAEDASGVEAAYGLGAAALAALYAENPTLPPSALAAPDLELPPADRGPAVEALEAHRRRYGNQSRFAHERRPLDDLRPHAGIAYGVAESPLPGAERAGTISASASAIFVAARVDLTRPALGGDASGWALGLEGRLPVGGEALVMTVGLAGGRQWGGPGERHSHVATPIGLHLGTPLLRVSSVIGINWLRINNGTAGPPEAWNFTPWTTSIELPLLPIGPRVYARVEATRYLGADMWAFGAAVGWRLIFADDL